MKETIFTKIARHEIPAYIVDENEEFMAFLDISPSTYGQTLVTPKEWHDSYIFRNEQEFINRFMEYVRTIADLLVEKLGFERCILMFEGFGVDHLHAKLYPRIGNVEDALNPREKVEFNKDIAEEILAKLAY
jgi:histidine triad (HIT) family protein